MPGNDRASNASGREEIAGRAGNDGEGRRGLPVGAGNDGVCVMPDVIGHLTLTARKGLPVEPAMTKREPAMTEDRAVL